MTMRKSLSTAAIALAVAFAAPAYAASDSGTSDAAKSPSMEQTQAKPDTGATGTSMESDTMKSDSGAKAGADLKSNTDQTAASATATGGVTITSEDEGAAVRTADGEEIGEIEKVISSSGQADKVIISHGGFIGLGEKKAEVEASKLSRAEGEQDGFTLNMTKDQVAQLPEAQDTGDDAATGGAMGGSGAGTAPSAAPATPGTQSGSTGGGAAAPTPKPAD